MEKLDRVFDAKTFWIIEKIFLYIKTSFDILKNPNLFFLKNSNSKVVKYFSPLSFLALNLFFSVALINLESTKPEGPFEKTFVGDFVTGYIFEIFRYLIGYVFFAALLAIRIKNSKVPFEIVLRVLGYASAIFIPAILATRLFYLGINYFYGFEEMYDFIWGYMHVEDFKFSYLLLLKFLGVFSVLGFSHLAFIFCWLKLIQIGLGAYRVEVRYINVLFVAAIYLCLTYAISYGATSFQKRKQVLTVVSYKEKMWEFCVQEGLNPLKLGTRFSNFSRMQNISANGKFVTTMAEILCELLIQDPQIDSAEVKKVLCSLSERKLSSRESVYKYIEKNLARLEKEKRIEYSGVPKWAIEARGKIEEAAKEYFEEERVLMGKKLFDRNLMDAREEKYSFSWGIGYGETIMRVWPASFWEAIPRPVSAIEK